MNRQNDLRVAPLPFTRHHADDLCRDVSIANERGDEFSQLFEIHGHAPENATHVPRLHTLVRVNAVRSHGCYDAPITSPDAPDNLSINKDGLGLTWFSGTRRASGGDCPCARTSTPAARGATSPLPKS